MSKHSFMDSILNRPSQRYTEPLDPKPSRKSRHQAPSDLPNAPNRPDSILAGNMFKSAGPGSLQHGGGVYSQAPSVRSGKSNTSRFSLFRKKGRAPSVSGSVYYDGSSSVAPTDISVSPSKARWWESGGLTRNNYSSRPPSVAGSVFSEPEAAGPPGFPRISDSLGRAPPRGARSDYGGSSSRKRYSSQTSAPPLPSLTDKGSVSSMRLQSGVAPLGQQQPNLMRQASSASLARAPSMSGPNAAELARPISPAASMGRTRRTSQGAANGSSDWNSFVKSMAGTEVAQMWESMPTLAPKAPRTSEKRSSMVANRIRKELEQDAQYQQVQRDPGVIQQDLLARAASQVIGTVPQAPMSTLSEHHLASQPIHLEPGQVVAPISPVYSPVASTSSVNVAQMPASMSMQASAVMDGTGASVPMAVPQAVAPVTVLHAPQPQQYYVQPQVQPQAMPQQYVQAVPAPVPQEQREATTAAPQRLVPGQGPVQAAMVAPALPPVAMSPPAQTYAPVAVQAPRAEPPAPMAVPLAVTAPTPVTPEPTRSAPQQVVTPATISPASAPLAPPTTAQYLADRVDEEGSDDEESEPEEVSSDESEDSDETSSDEGLVGGGQPTLDVVAEEDEEGSSVGHAYHHEMRSHKSIKGKGPSRNYDDYEARLHLRQASVQSQADSSRDEDTARSGVQIRVSEPSDSRQIPTDAAGLSQPGVSLSSTTSSSVQPESQTEAVAIAQPALAQAVAAPVLAAKDRPRLVTRPSEGSDYASATSGRSTPTARDQADEEDAEDEAAVVASIAQAPIGAKTAEGMSSTDTASIRPSVRTSRSSRPDTAQRRLSEVSLGTSFAASGILRRPESSLRRAGDGDSDSDAERSDEDADLRSKSLAEQDRLRKMNVGEDFFGPSLSNILESFDRINYSDSTVNKMKRELSQSSAKANGDATAPISNGIDANAQQAINDVRQKRADAEGKRRNSADTTGVAPSFAAVWLLNQAQGSNDSAAARGGLTDDAGDKTVTASQAPAGANTAVTLPEEPKVSVLARPRPVARKPKEEEEVSPAEAQVVAEKPQEAVRQVTSNAMATSGPQPIVPNADAASAATQSNETTPKKATEVVAAKDSPTPVKSAAKPKQPRSLADTLFGISFRSPSKDKKEKKEKEEKAKKEKKDKKDKEKKEKKDRSTHSRTTSVDSTASASNRSDSSSVVSTPASPSVKSLGKQRATEDPSIAATPSQQPNGIVPSETTTNFATPPQSMGNLQSAAGVASSPEKFHTAHDLKALANTAVPVYPTDVKALPVMQNGAAGKDQMEADRALLVPAVGSTNTEGAVNGDHSAPPTSSEASLASTALTSPEAEAASKPMDADRAVVTEAAASQPTAVAPQPSTTEMPEKRLVMPPPPALEEVMAPSQEDRTPLGKPSEVPAVGINLIPPTPPALESRNSYTSSQAPGTSTIDEYGEDAAPHRPSLMSRSSSQRTAVRADTKPNGSSEGVSRSKSMAPTKKGIWQEYKGKGLSLPPGLVATTIDSSELRRLTGQDKKLPSQPAASTAAAVPGSVHLNGAAPALPVKPVVGQIVPTAPTSVLESPPRPPRATPSPSPKSRRSSGSLSPLPPQSPAVARILADAPPVPQIPVGYQSASSVSGPSSRLYAPSIASSEPDWDSRPVSPAPSAVPSQSGRSVGSHVSSSVHSASYRSSPRPEYSYVNHHELSPYAKKMRALSPSPAVPTLSQTGNRHSLMSAINEWESQVPDREETVAGLSPYPSRPTSPSPSPYPTLPASTVSRTSSVISSISSPAVVRNAPLGAATNQYLQPPIARSLMSHDGLSAVSESALESLNPPSVVEGRSGASSVNSSSPSASQSALSLSSTIPTSMPTVPTSYRPNKDPKRFTTNADDLLNNRTTMQTVAVTSGAFANRSKSVVKRKKSSDIGGDRRTSTDIPVHLQDELAVTTLSLTAHTPPPRKIGSHQVLVQVIAVAIDETDKLLLREKIRAENAFGFVPGRSFCGRIVECGYEVKKMRKGDIIFGLQDSRKCGALAEFMVVDHNRICHAPSDCLTTEQIAALPSAGVMAHQLMAHCSQLPRGARVLILNAHDGVGLLTLQESVGLGLVIVAQCPPTISDGVAVCQANGAHEVVIGEPLWAINSLHESSFDLIVDTVGGRKIYDASRRILASDGQYCTCYGDEHGTNNPNLKSHFRSLRRAFFKKDKKNLGYEWVGVDTGEDCKEALEAVKRAAERGDVCPRLRSVLPFADAGRAFEVGSRKVDDEPGAIVVRVS